MIQIAEVSADVGRAAKSVENHKKKHARNFIRPFSYVIDILDIININKKQLNAYCGIKGLTVSKYFSQ